MKLSFTAAFSIKLCFVQVKTKKSINDECSSWFNRIGDFLMSVWGRRKEILYGNGLVGEVNQSNTIPECEVYGTECYHG